MLAVQLGPKLPSTNIQVKPQYMQRLQVRPRCRPEHGFLFTPSLKSYGLEEGQLSAQ